MATFGGDLPSDVDVEDSVGRSVVTNAGADSTEVSLLWQACAAGNKTDALHLLRAGADVDFRRPLDGVSCLYIAAQNGFDGICRHLIEAGADVNSCRNTKATPLFIATQRNHTAVVAYLLSAGADTELENDQRCTPFVLACNLGHTECALMLLERGCNRRHRATGLTPMMWCRAERRHETLDAIRAWTFDNVLQPVIVRHLLRRCFRSWISVTHALLEAKRVAREKEQEQIGRKQRLWQAMLDGAPIPPDDELQLCSFQTHLTLPDSWADVSLVTASRAQAVAPSSRSHPNREQQGAAQDRTSQPRARLTESPQTSQPDVAVGVEAKVRRTLSCLSEPLPHAEAVTNDGNGSPRRNMTEQLASQSAAYRRQRKSREVLVAGNSSELLRLHETLMSQHFDWTDK